MRLTVRIALLLLTLGVLWIRVEQFRTAAAAPAFTGAGAASQCAAPSPSQN